MAIAARGPRHFLVMGSMLAALLVVLAGSSTAPAAASSHFVDVSGTHADNIERIAEAGVTEGCEPDRFCPSDTVTREQMASFLVRALDLPAADSNPFVDAGGVHEGAIASLAAAEITLGCTDDRFCPAEPVSRAQMATFLARGFELAAPQTTYFTDGGVHQENINAVADAGITAGCDRLGTRFCPSEHVTRAQMASFLARAMGLDDRVSIPMLLEPGDEGSSVEVLQSRLRSLGYAVTDADGSYGSGTADAIRAFQLVHGLRADGRYGPETRAAMASPQRPASVVGSFTTPLVPGQDRNNNIHLAADLIDGDVVAPGGSYSLDDAIGPRTTERGFGPNGYIDDEGEIVSVVGGGISQMGTTFLNAAWLAGIELVDFRQHTIYFERYPMCREATLARNLLDVVVVNDTPYPLTVSTSYTSESVTVSLIGAPFATVDSWTGAPYDIEGPGGAFSVDCGRTVHHPDGSDSSQQYTWRYHEGYPG